MHLLIILRLQQQRQQILLPIVLRFVFGDQDIEIVLIRQGIVDLFVEAVDTVEDLVEVKDAVDNGLGDLVEW
jgi:hypothetical protein